MKSKIKKFKELVRPGEKFKVISTDGLNGCSKGDILICKEQSSSGRFVAISQKNKIPNMVELGYHVERIGMTIKDYEERKQSLTKELEDIDLRIEFMQKKSIDELDERRFLTYILIREINKDSPLEDKEEVINEIVERTLENGT